MHFFHTQTSEQALRLPSQNYHLLEHAHAPTYHLPEHAHPSSREEKFIITSVHSQPTPWTDCLAFCSWLWSPMWRRGIGPGPHRMPANTCFLLATAHPLRLASLPTASLHNQLRTGMILQVSTHLFNHFQTLQWPFGHTNFSYFRKGHGRDQAPSSNISATKHRNEGILATGEKLESQSLSRINKDRFSVKLRGNTTEQRLHLIIRAKNFHWIPNPLTSRCLFVFLQMRDVTTNKIVGLWDENDIAKGLDCNGKVSSALTHKNSGKT